MGCESSVRLVSCARRGGFVVQIAGDCREKAGVVADIWPCSVLSVREKIAMEGGMNEGSTHWEGCWKDRKHHECALAEIERLKRTLERGECIHCDEPLERESKDHWRSCKNHPANAEIKRIMKECVAKCKNCFALKTLSEIAARRLALLVRWLEWAQTNPGLDHRDCPDRWGSEVYEATRKEVESE